MRNSMLRDKLPDSFGTASYQKTNFIVFCLFFFYIVYRYLEIGYRIPALGSIHFEFILGSIMVAIALPQFLIGTEKARTSLYLWSSLLIMILGVMTLFSVDYSFSSTTFYDRVIKFSMLSLFFAAFVRNPKELRWSIAAFLLACLKLEQEGFVGTITGSLIWDNQGIPRLHGSTPIYADPNSFTGMALGILPFVLYYYPIASTWIKTVLLIQTGLALNIVVFTGSRTGYVALLAGLGMIVSRAENRKRSVVLLLVAMMATVPLIPKDYIERFTTIFTLHDDEGHSIEKRQVILEDAWAIFKEYPFGVGVDTFPIVRAQKFGRTQDTHNLYFQIATNIGIQGLIVFVGFIVAMQRVLNRLRISFNEQLQRLRKLSAESSTAPPDTLLSEHINDLKWLKATAQAVFLFVFLRLVLGIFGMDLYEIYWWFSLGLTVALLNMDIQVRKKTTLLLSRNKNDSSTAKSLVPPAIVTKEPQKVV